MSNKKQKKSEKKKNSPLKVVNNASSGSLSKSSRSRPNLLVQGVSPHLTVSKLESGASQGSNTERGHKNIISKINRSMKVPSDARSPPHGQNSNEHNDLNNSLVSVEDSIFSRDNLMKSNFKQRPELNIKCE